MWDHTDLSNGGVLDIEIIVEDIVSNGVYQIFNKAMYELLKICQNPFFK